MTDTHPVDLLGGRALGLLEEPEQRALDQHLAGCRSCRDALAELTETAGLLAAAPADQVGAPPPEAVLQRALGQVRTERAGRRRRTVLAAAAGLVLLAGTAGAGTWVGTQLGRDQVAAPVADRVLTGSAPSGASVRVELVAAAGWSRLRVSVTGLPAGQPCQMVALDRAGRAQVAGSWVVGAVPGRTVDAAVAIPTADIAQVQVRTPDGRTLVSARA